MHKLPLNINLNTIAVLKQLNLANSKLSELRGMMKLLPNLRLILNLLNLSESKDSSAIENIITTYDELYKELTLKEPYGGKPKEIISYNRAILTGTEIIRKNGFISTNNIIAIHQIIEANKSGIRKLPGTVIKNDSTGEIVHIPPQNEDEIRHLLQNLEGYINEDHTYDPLVQMALIHYQFETIHPFYDGNGRMGRILNILYLLLKSKIEEPILYLSKYIIETKNEYYALLNLCQQDINHIEKFVLYILKGVEKTSAYTINLILNINEAINNTVSMFKERLPNIYRFDIVEHLFLHMYTKNEFFRENLNISRATATKYLKMLETEGFIVSERVGKEVIYKNIQIFNLVTN